ncbi:hydrogenase [Thalassotalea insulae]|uniref:Hydrogenase n=1 Tax=Thalassotalea insulae TaxID=2056778 RepID=A0ABQ6GRK1_9GAMM|nr:cytochrome b/b6 domain-containing protein [Thalassotalea insulae]GLX78553.1 hydrogenase [Thalassotalea insulae]
MIKQYLVWDLPIRIFHWGFVILLLALWYTSEQDRGLIEVHMKLGYLALGFVLFRIIWGFVGTTHARFKNFVPNFYQVIIYIRGSLSDKTTQYAGHNPAGSLMVLLMLLLVLVQASTGLFINDEVFSSGPYSGVLSSELERLLKFIHSNGFNAILLMSSVHVFAVFYYLLVKKQNLIKPMVNGKKAAHVISEDAAIESSKIVKAAVVAIAVAAFVYWLVVLNAPVIEEYYY